MTGRHAFERVDHVERGDARGPVASFVEDGGTNHLPSIPADQNPRRRKGSNSPDPPPVLEILDFAPSGE